MNNKIYKVTESLYLKKGLLTSMFITNEIKKINNETKEVSNLVIFLKGQEQPIIYSDNEEKISIIKKNILEKENS